MIITLSNYYIIEEVQTQDQPPKTIDEHTVQLSLPCHCSNVVTHGSKIALQPLYDKTSWLSCENKVCGKATCPPLFVNGGDWSKCAGEVFQIFRCAGPGVVKVGDFVGFYIAEEWLSMVAGRGQRAPCPGTPTVNYGFSAQDKWNQCWGEVFQIYAKGKSIGDAIENHDDVTIYYVQEKKWVGLVGNYPPGYATCPGQTRPPPPDRYGKCWGEVFELWLHQD